MIALKLMKKEKLLHPNLNSLIRERAPSTQPKGRE
jgi:hypothetical protein